MARMLVDKQIRKMLPVDPFVDCIVRRDGGKKVMSYGLDSFGYDIRLGNDFCYPVADVVLDPKGDGEMYTKPIKITSPITMQPRTHILGRSLETIKMLDNVFAIVFPKSSYARMGVIAHITPIDPGYKGQLTVEISNLSGRAAKIYPREGIAKLVFFIGRPKSKYTGSYSGKNGVNPIG